MRKRNLQTLCIVVVALMMAGTAQAATITQTEGGGGSWMNTIWGTPAAAPTAGNDYVNAAMGAMTEGYYFLRTSPQNQTQAGNADFGGDSLTIVNQTMLLIKQDAGQTGSIKGGTGNLTLQAGSYLKFGGNGTANTSTQTLDIGSLIVEGDSIIKINQAVKTGLVAGTLTGSGNLVISRDSLTYTNRCTVGFADVSDYTGDITVNYGVDLDFDADATLADLVLDSSVLPTNKAVLNVDKVLTFSSVLADGVSIADGTYTGAALTALGANFTNGGGTLIVGAARGCATDLAPSGTIDKDAVANQFTWNVPVDPNIVSVTSDIVYYSKLTANVTADDPNFANPANGAVTLTNRTSPVALAFAYDTTYFWRVDSHVTWDSNDITGNWTDVIPVRETFVVLPDDLPPVVAIPDAGDNIITWLANLPETGLAGTVDDHGEGDISPSGISWEITAGPGIGKNTAMQMINRTGTADLVELAQITSEPNLLRDWIGTDSRESGSNVLTIKLSGLPNGNYTWKSYHHDIENQTGVFDVVVTDFSGTTTTTGIDISDSNEVPVTTFTAPIVVSGGSDVTLSFNKPKSSNTEMSFFVMNGFELTGTGDPLKIDFTNSDTPLVMAGYQAYLAQQEVAATFTAQSFAAFGTTVTVTPTWDYVSAIVTDTTTNVLAPTASFNVTGSFPNLGVYTVKLTATDSAAQSGSDTLQITVATDACAAAKAQSGFALNYYDNDDDCDVDLVDFAALAKEWLVDQNLTDSFYN